MGYYISNENMKFKNLLKKESAPFPICTIDQLYKALNARGWCEMSAFSPNMWNDDLRCNGQCNGTVLLVQELFGGDIIKYENPNREKKMHYFNRIDNCDIDLTSEQFGNVELDYSGKSRVANWNISNLKQFSYYKSCYILKLRILKSVN